MQRVIVVLQEPRGSLVLLVRMVLQAQWVLEDFPARGVVLDLLDQRGLVALMVLPDLLDLRARLVHLVLLASLELLVLREKLVQPVPVDLREHKVPEASPELLALLVLLVLLETLELMELLELRVLLDLPELLVLLDFPGPVVLLALRVQAVLLVLKANRVTQVLLASRVKPVQRVNLAQLVFKVLLVLLVRKESEVLVENPEVLDHLDQMASGGHQVTVVSQAKMDLLDQRVAQVSVVLPALLEQRETLGILDVLVRLAFLVQGA